MVKMLKDVKILLADDDEEVLAALNEVLRSEGYEVIMAKNGREAIEHFHEGHIDIALLDLNMPIKGGWETFERLTTIHPLLPITVITAMGKRTKISSSVEMRPTIWMPRTLM